MINFGCTVDPMRHSVGWCKVEVDIKEQLDVSDPSSHFSFRPGLTAVG
jgi:hypothetical protein